MQFGHDRAYMPFVRAIVQGRANEPNPDERVGLSPLTTLRTVNTESRTKLSPAFEAWLQAYRTRLERFCESQNSPTE